MLATGDLVDYIFEHGDDRKGGGNFRYLERLILGQASSSDPEGAPNPELHVPIFTSLGNHDYVLNPSELWFEIDLEGIENLIFRRFEPYNLSGDDAKAIQGGKKLLLSREEGEQMVESLDRPHWYYEQRINRQPNYVIELGDKHRIVMLDTGPNADVITGIGDALEELLRSVEPERDDIRQGDTEYRGKRPHGLPGRAEGHTGRRHIRGRHARTPAERMAQRVPALFPRNRASRIRREETETSH